QAQGLSSNGVTVRVTGDWMSAVCSTKLFTVVVNEVNSAPVLAAIANQTIAQGSTLTLTITASDGDVPTNALTYSVVAGPAEASRSEERGVGTGSRSRGRGGRKKRERVRG